MSNYNTLPARPLYIKKVLSALKGDGLLTALDIQKKTGLTKTQVVCTLDALSGDEIIEKVQLKGKSLYQKVMLDS